MWQLCKGVIVIIGWLLLIEGCKQSSQPDIQTVFVTAATIKMTSCTDGTCCGREGAAFNYIKPFNGDTVFLMKGEIIDFVKPLPTGFTFRPLPQARICKLTVDVFTQVMQTDTTKSSIRCRVWGHYFTDDSPPGYTNVGPGRFFLLTKAELLK
jgi:hypothetical protein